MTIVIVTMIMLTTLQDQGKVICVMTNPIVEEKGCTIQTERKTTDIMLDILVLILGMKNMILIKNTIDSTFKKQGRMATRRPSDPCLLEKGTRGELVDDIHKAKAA